MAIFSDWASSLEPDLRDRARFQQLVGTWKAKADGALPTWRDFDLKDVRGWYGCLVLTNHAVPDAPFCRLFGSKLSDLFGGDFTNKHPRELFGAQRMDMGNAFTAHLDAVARDGGIGLASFEAHRNHDAWRAKALSLPLAGAMVVTAFELSGSGYDNARFDPANAGLL